MAEKFEFRDDHGAHGPQERRTRMADYVANIPTDRLFVQEERALAALAALTYKSNYSSPASPLDSPAPGKLFGPRDTLPGGGSLPKPPNKSDGFDGGAFYRPEARELVMVSRGTETEADWINNFRAVVFGYTRASQAALDYAVRCVGAVRSRGLPLDRVTCTGHSLGGAMAEIQAGLLNRRLDTPVDAVSAVGFASAGFRKAMATLSAGSGVDAVALADTIHYVRPNDPIRQTYFSGKPWANVVGLDLNVYAVVRKKANPQAERTYFVDPFPFAHSSYLYFYLWDETGPFHYVKTYGGVLKRRDGRENLDYDLGYGLPPHYA